jgi:hypothetical protein
MFKNAMKLSPSTCRSSTLAGYHIHMWSSERCGFESSALLESRAEAARKDHTHCNGVDVLSVPPFITTYKCTRIQSYKYCDAGSVFVTASRHAGGGVVRVTNGGALPALASESSDTRALVSVFARISCPAAMAAIALEELSDDVSASRGFTVVSGPCALNLTRLARATALAAAAAAVVCAIDLSLSAASRFTWNIAPCILGCLERTG